MAGSGQSVNPPTSESASISIGHHDTALAIVPPRHLWPAIERLRALYDKHHGQWPPHINFCYPFAHQESLERASQLIGAAVAGWAGDSGEKLSLCLDSVDAFVHRNHNTIFIHDSGKDHNTRLTHLRSVVLRSLGQRSNNYRMHMSIAQTEDANSSPHKFLLHKVGLLPSVEWEVDQLYILVRQRLQGASVPNQMKIWGTISLSTGAVSQMGTPLSFYDKLEDSVSAETEDETGEQDQLQTRPPYYFSEEDGIWKTLSSPSEIGSTGMPKRFTVATYNVLGEFHWPPSQARYPTLVKNILSDRARADVLVLQEVQDTFLSHLLADEDIRSAYPFTSHGPPSQPDVEPLPSLLNLVVLSKWGFDWEWVTFHRRHKGSLVVRFRDIGKWDDAIFLPAVLATIHLTHGLTDGAVAAKKTEIQSILNYLAKTYSDHPWILAGDFNISTSSYTVQTALRKQAISPQTAAYLPGFERTFANANLSDAWTVSRSEVGDESDGESGHQADGDDILEGEQGATYDPIVNKLAESIVGSGFNMRPQRIDRILVRGEDLLTVGMFNKFGFVQGEIPDGDGVKVSYPSDHWGVRCVFKLGAEQKGHRAEEVAKQIVPVHLRNASPSLADIDELKQCLSRLHIIPTEDETEQRKTAFDLFKEVLLDACSGGATAARTKPQMVIVPVGSYGLGVWTPTSDIDCVCIGPFSSKTFFALATPKLRKAVGRGVKVLRRVHAHSGTMLELEILGIKMDLQYCPATSVAERWPDVLRLPPSDPVFTLSAQTLSKLKSIRDMDYIRRSVPDIVTFRLAHRAIKAWAKSRGIYSARFGFLSGLQISVLLARVCKLLVRDVGSAVLIADVLPTFFCHYATFDWKNKVAFDPFFHRQRLQYVRTHREPLAILGYYPPALNASHAASLPSVRTIAEEFRRAGALLSTEGMTWTRFLCGGDDAYEPSPTTLSVDPATGAADFLKAFKTYVKIDVQYWGLSLAKGSMLVGWLESRCVALLVDINRRLPALHARIWPARFVDAADTTTTAAPDRDGDSRAEETGKDRDYQGCYLVGLDKLDDAMSREDLQVAAGALRSVLQKFEAQIRGDERYFDARSAWMGAAVVNQAELGELQVDSRAWGEYMPGDDESDEEEEEEEEGLIGRDEGVGSLDLLTIDEGDAVAASKKHKKQPSGSRTALPRQEGSTRRLRTAADVISRLRWDPDMDSGDYVVGYEDRFVGAREKALDAWKSEQTDEEFIPQHRILYFKRRSDGVVVWERRTRKDEIFGSGT